MDAQALPLHSTAAMIEGLYIHKLAHLVDIWRQLTSEKRKKVMVNSSARTPSLTKWMYPMI